MWEHYKEANHGFKCWERLSNENNDFCGCTHGAPTPDEIKLYALRNSKGEYLRARGRNGSGKSWVPDLLDAKFYTKVSQARSRVTYFSNNNPQKLPVPQLIEFKVVETKVIDETERVKDAKRKKELEAERKKERQAKQEIETAEKVLRDAQARLNRLRGR